MRIHYIDNRDDEGVSRGDDDEDDDDGDSLCRSRAPKVKSNRSHIKGVNIRLINLPHSSPLLLIHSFIHSFMPENISNVVSVQFNRAVRSQIPALLKEYSAALGPHLRGRFPQKILC